jgi:hypothetical protein
VTVTELEVIWHSLNGPFESITLNGLNPVSLTPKFHVKKLVLLYTTFPMDNLLPFLQRCSIESLEVNTSFGKNIPRIYANYADNLLLIRNLHTLRLLNILTFQIREEVAEEKTALVDALEYFYENEKVNPKRKLKIVVKSPKSETQWYWNGIQVFGEDGKRFKKLNALFQDMDITIVGLNNEGYNYFW